MGLRSIANYAPRTTAWIRLAINAVRLGIATLDPRASTASWSAFMAPPQSAGLPVNDMPVSFAARCVLERRYKSLIEIGTFDGSRAIELKRLFPEIDVHGMDIQDNFRVPFAHGGVSFSLFDLDAIAAGADRSAVIANGVLCCMSQPQLRQFLKAAHDGNRDIIFHELTPVFEHSGTIRRGVLTWYHDYKDEFTRAGYQLAAPRHVGQAGQFDINFFELGYFNLAIPK